MGVLERGPVPYLIMAVAVISLALLAWHLMPEGEPEMESAENLREILQNGETPEARSNAAAQLGEMRDEASMPLLFEAMDDAEPLVRGQANSAVEKIMNAGYYFNPVDPPEQRRALIAQIKRDWEAFLKRKSSEQAASGTGAGPP